MAKRGSKAPGPAPELPQRPLHSPDSNEARGDVRPSRDLSQLAVYPFIQVSEMIDGLTTKVEHQASDINLEDADRLLRQVQLAQGNCTKALNSMSAYRKAISSILNKRREERAALRKAAGKPASEQGIDVIPVPPPAVEPESGSPEGGDSGQQHD